MEVTSSGKERPLVVCVDDDMKSLAALRRALRTEAVDIMTTVHPREALHWVRERDVDMILSDVFMDGMNGLSLLEEVRRCRPSTRRVAITAFPQVLMALADRAPGLSATFTKPWNEKTLRLTVREFAAERRAAHAVWSGRGGER